MKKTLIALAALATVGAVQAQSSVTVSGRMDVGYSDKDLKVNGVNTQSETIGANPFLTSFLAVSGSEDLGGGNRANFRVETAMDGSTATTLGGRGFWAELQGKNWGELRVGLQNTGARDVWISMIQTGAINIVGDLNSSTAEDAGGTAAHTAFGTAIKYTTPSFNGLRVSGSVSKALTESTSGTKTGADATSVGAFYVAGKLSLAGSYQSSTQYSPSVTTAASIVTTSIANATACGDGNVCTTDNSAGSGFKFRTRSTDAATAAAFSTDVKTTALGAMYNFGPATASVIHMNREEKATNAATPASDRKATTFSASAPVGKAVLFASYGTGENVLSGVKYDLKAMQLGARYFLSKRTYAYLATGQVKQELNAANKNDYKETAVGMLHLF